MPSNSDRPFADDTVKIRAVFVPEAAADQVSPATIATALDYDAVKLPAILVPDGAPPPGYPYENFGHVVFRQDEAVAETRAYTSWTQSAKPRNDAPEDSAPGPTLPRTRYRFGSALTGHSPGRPPNPTLPGALDNPARVANELLRGIARATHGFATQYAGRAANRATSNTRAEAGTSVDAAHPSPEAPQQE
jgi:hypothetical protein